MPINQKVLELANHISRKKMGSKDEIKATDPEYLILEPVVTTEMAEVVLCMQIRQKETAETLAAKSGKSVEETAAEATTMSELPPPPPEVNIVV